MKRVMPVVVLIGSVLALLFSPLACSVASESEGGDRAWSLRSGETELVVAQGPEGVWLTKFGPAASDVGAGLKSPLVLLSIAGKSLAGQDWSEIHVSEHRDEASSAVIVVEMLYEPKNVSVEVRITAQGDTGVFTWDVLVQNLGTEVVEIDRATSFCLCWSDADATVRHLDLLPAAGSDLMHGLEYHDRTDKVGSEPVVLDSSDVGRSTGLYAAWWMLHLPDSDISYTAQLAYSGNWKATFESNDTKGGTAAYEMTFDNRGPLRIGGGGTFRTPRVSVTATLGTGLDAPVLAHQRYLRQFVIPKQSANDPLLVEYNSWYAYFDKVDAEKLLKAVPAAARVGCEVFVVDANWHYCPESPKQNWAERLGDWVVDPSRFPEGLAPVAEAARAHGMKFGIWFEPECASYNSQVLKEHPEWFLDLHGKVIRKRGNRCLLDYAKPEVREYMLGRIDALMQDTKLDWVKFDNNVDVGSEFDAAGDLETNTRLHDHMAGYYLFLDTLAEKYPDLIIENCAAGAHRSDPGILAHTHASWVSDTVEPRMSVQAVWGSLIVTPPEMCNHWMTGRLAKQRGHGEIDRENMGWFDFMCRIAMNGQYGYSTQLEDWPDDLIERAKSNTALYKQIREVLHGADVYHLVAPVGPPEDLTGWMALQFVSPKSGDSVVTAYRLGRSEPKQHLSLRGLEAGAVYTVQRDGKTGETLSGKTLLADGLTVELPDEWNAQVIELRKTAP